MTATPKRTRRNTKAVRNMSDELSNNPVLSSTSSSGAAGYGKIREAVTFNLCFTDSPTFLVERNGLVIPINLIVVCITKGYVFKPA